MRKIGHNQVCKSGRLYWMFDNFYKEMHIANIEIEN